MRRRTSGRLPVWLLTHPLELMLAVATVVSGVLGLIGYGSPSVDGLPSLRLLLYYAVSLLGAAGVMWGIVGNDPPQHTGLHVAVERASLFLLSVAYVGLGVLIVANNGGRGLVTGQAAILIGVGLFLRTVAIRRASKIVLDELRRARRRDE